MRQIIFLAGIMAAPCLTATPADSLPGDAVTAGMVAEFVGEAVSDFWTSAEPVFVAVSVVPAARWV